MKTIPLTQGKFALVDDADYEAVSQFKWCASRRGRSLFYARRHIRKPNGTWGKQYLHQFLFPGVSRIDHRDGDGLNNQRYNLRPATQMQNCRGFKQKRLGSTSKFRGVSWCRTYLKWCAQIAVEGTGRSKFLGYFDIEEDAARAYDVAARKYFGEFASLNFP